jgi:hypothetical protein
MRYVIAAMLLLGLFSPAQAHQRRVTPSVQPMCFIFCPPVSAPVVLVRHIKHKKTVDAPVLRQTRSKKLLASASRKSSWRAVPESRVVEHPAGCAWRAFCGCGAAVHIFGHPVRGLEAAAAWYRFPRTLPAPGMAAVRPHHVMVLEADLGGGVWQVYDANSGGHATRIHAQSILRYTIVNPRI